MLKITSFLAVFTSLSLFAATNGEMLEKQLWEDLKAKNWTNVEKKIAPNFLSVHSDGSRNRSEEIELIKNLNISAFALSDFKVIESEETIIVSYKVAVAETIDKKRLSNTPAPRLSVWQKVGDTWQWIAHANLHPIRN